MLINLFNCHCPLGNKTYNEEKYPKTARCFFSVSNYSTGTMGNNVPKQNVALSCKSVLHIVIVVLPQNLENNTKAQMLGN